MFKEICKLGMILGLTVTITSCGKDYEYVTKNRTVTVVETQEFEGLYRFDFGSQIELIQGENGRITVVSSGQLLTSINPQNNTFAQHPTINKRDLEAIDGLIRFSQNFNYTDGNDVEVDLTGANIRGQRRTDVEMYFNESGKFVLTLVIYSDKINNNTNFVVAERTFTEL